MPSTMPAAMVRNSATSSQSCASPTTSWVKTMPRPDSMTTPMMMPAQAQASATVTALRAPSAIASMTFFQVTLPRVDGRSAATGKHSRVPTRAAIGAL